MKYVRRQFDITEAQDEILTNKSLELRKNTGMYVSRSRVLRLAINKFFKVGEKK